MARPVGMPIKAPPQVKSVRTTVTPRAGQVNQADVTIVIDWNAVPPAGVEWFPPASEALMFSHIKVEPVSDRSTKITAAAERLPGLKIGSKLESVVAAGDPAHRVGVAVPIDVGSVGWKD